MSIASVTTSHQVQTALRFLQELLGENLLAVYLHGSAVSSGLKPQSDIDLLVCIKQSLPDETRKKLLAFLLNLSSTYPARPEAARCLEVIIFTLDELKNPHFPAMADFIYGEWLRESFLEGELPEPVADPEMTLILAQANKEAVSLWGAAKEDLLPVISTADIRKAMLHGLPDLLANFQGDERNVLLTLARMWYTAETGEFTSKDQAALWAAALLPETMAQVMTHASAAYLGQIDENWASHAPIAEQTANYLHMQIVAKMTALG